MKIVFLQSISMISVKHFIISHFQDIDYDGFRRFLDAFLDCETPEELSRHLFVSFLKPSVAQSQIQGKVLNQMAAVSSNAACAAVTSHTKGKNRVFVAPTNKKRPYMQKKSITQVMCCK